MITTINEWKTINENSDLNLNDIKINEELRNTTKTEETVMNYLNELRDSGVTNMFGAVPYIMDEFPQLEKNDASRILSLWMANFVPEGNYKQIEESLNKFNLNNDVIDETVLTVVDNIIEGIESQEHYFAGLDLLKNGIKLLIDTGMDKQQILDYCKRKLELSSVSESNENTVTIEGIEIVKSLEDIDEIRPTRMKRPPADSFTNDYAGRPGVGIYIQDEAEEIMQDKYGKERGTKMWQGSIGHGARGNAMFAMCDKVMKEKSFLYHELFDILNENGIQARRYWDVSYYSLWKLWMNSIGKTFKVKTREEVDAEKEAKRITKEEAEREAQAKHTEKINKEAKRDLNDAIAGYDSISLLDLTPAKKDIDRIESLMDKDNRNIMAKNMAKSIKDISKLKRRAKAIVDIYQDKLDNGDIKQFTYFNFQYLYRPFDQRINELID